MKAKGKRSTRNERRWREIAKIVGPGVHKLPAFFRHGLYHLRNRSGLPDSELVLAFNRCEAWLARARDGIGECECGCGTKMAVNAKNAKQSVWCLDHCPLNKKFRGILAQKCNTELGDGNRRRKMAHLSYVESCETRIQQDTPVVVLHQNEFLSDGAVPD